MTRRRHNGASKTHDVFSIEVRGRQDSARVVCSCGYSELVATWHTKTEDGGFEDSEAVVAAVEQFLRAAYPEKGRRR